jgi:hypothetical protein
MQSLRNQLVREAAALYGFVDSISASCTHLPQSVAFTEASARFFRYIEQLADATKQHLAEFPPVSIQAAAADEFQETRGELFTIRRVWKQLHQFIKPASDADTLNQPTALVSAMLERTRRLPGLQDADFAIFLTETFDYLQVNPTWIRGAARDLAFIVTADEFPSGLGLIGIPSTQGSSLLLNCLVAHEIGEYVYSEKSLSDHLRPEVRAAVEIVYGAEYQAKDKTEKSRLMDTVISWCKELFCDLFAVYLIGPCYTFAYAELFDLPNLLDRSGAVATTNPRPPIHFYPLHPSHPFRVKYQADLLKRLEWWPQIRDIDSRYMHVLDALSELEDKDFIDSADTGSDPLVKAFFKVIPEINSHLGKIVGSLDTGVHECGQLREHIAHYLQEGIVPSTLRIQIRDEDAQQATPSSVALLNGFACFYLENIEKLMDRIELQDRESAKDRVYWIRKLESWTSKALEDITLLNEL